MKRLGVGLSFAAVIGLVACASEEIDETPLLGGKAGNAGSGGSHVGNAGRAGGTSTPGSAGNVAANQGGATGSLAGAPSSGAGVPGVGGTSAVGAGGLVGASGSIAHGGSSGNGASGGGSPVFESGTCASSPSLSLSYQQASNNPKQITGHYQFSNTTDTPIPLAQLKIRYFFSNEETSGWKTAIYDAKLDGGTGGYRAISGTTLAVSPLGTTVPGADSYIELSFSSALSIEKGAIATVSWDLQPNNYSPPDQVQTDDYSYNAAALAYTVWDHVVIYQGTTLVWGCTPKEAGGTGGAGGVGGSGAVGGSAGASGSGASGASNGGASSAGMSGSAGAGAIAGAGGDTSTAGANSGGASSGGTNSGGSSGAAGVAGSNLGGASGSSGESGNQSCAGSSGSGGGSSGGSGTI